MEGETNAAVEGAFDGGATEVVVNDSHGSMYNLSPEAIDRRARLVQGRKPFSMVAAAADGHVRRGALRRLPRTRRPSARHASTHAERQPDPDDAQRATGRRVRAQRDVPRRPRRPGRDGRRRRRPGRGGRRVAALGGARRRQARHQPAGGRFGASGGRAGARARRSQARRRAGRVGRRRKADPAPPGSADRRWRGVPSSPGWPTSRR